MEILDSGCPKTVCREVWFKRYMRKLREKAPKTGS